MRDQSKVLLLKPRAFTIHEMFVPPEHTLGNKDKTVQGKWFIFVNVTYCGPGVTVRGVSILPTWWRWVCLSPLCHSAAAAPPAVSVRSAAASAAWTTH